MLGVRGDRRHRAVSLLAEGQGGQPKGKLWEMGLSGSSLCHGRTSLSWLAGGTSACLAWHELAVGEASERREVCCSATVSKNFLWASLFASASIATSSFSVLV